MQLGVFSMPLHRPEKPWKQALEEDREMVRLADRLGYGEVWIGEHFSTKVEQIPSAMVFLATLIHEAPRVRFGTGVVNLPHHHPVVVAAEAAMFDQLSGGRLMLGVGPGGLVSDAELFGHTDMGERNAMAAEAVDAILAVWKGDAPMRFDGRFWQFGLEDNVWKRFGVGLLPKPQQEPHPPLAMAMVGHASGSARVVAERDMIPISANFIPVADVASHWRVYAETRAALGRPADRSLWRIARNVLVTDSDTEAADLKADPDGPFAFYFRYLKSLRRIPELRDRQDAPVEELNPVLEVDEAIRDCVIAGTPASVLDGLVAMHDETGDFGVLLLAAHDWDETGRWQRSMTRMAEEVMPRFEQHVRATPAAAG